MTNDEKENNHTLTSHNQALDVAAKSINNDRRS